MQNFFALGGDSRTEYMADYLTSHGFNTKSDTVLCQSDVFDAVILPLPYTVDNIHIRGTDVAIEDFINKLNCKTVFLGKADEKIISEFISNNINYYDYNAREEFAQKNAVPTAQGVLNFILNNVRVTVSSLKTAVTGYGRCGKSICKILDSLGADVSSYSRRYASAADAEANGLKAFLIKDLADNIRNYDIIINTVPVRILNREIIDLINADTILIDVSSYPYGFDIEYAESVGKKINILPSLPGKCVPKTAGIIIAETIINIAEEGGLWKKSD